MWIGAIVVIVVLGAAAFWYFSGMSTPPPMYTLTIQAPDGQGTTSPTTGSTSYASGTAVPVTATPASGWKLDHWTLDGAAAGSSNPITVTMNAAHTLKAEFTQTQGSSITLYAGEISGGQFGFGLSATSITSPGPTITLKVGTATTITVINAGQTMHAFAITNNKVTGATVLFSSAVGSAAAPLAPGAQGSVTVTPSQAGSFYYICTVPGHPELGMWGVATVNP